MRILTALTESPVTAATSSKVRSRTNFRMMASRNNRQFSDHLFQPVHSVIGKCFAHLFVCSCVWCSKAESAAAKVRNILNIFLQMISNKIDADGV